jgi:hypothetical protein
MQMLREENSPWNDDDDHDFVDPREDDYEPFDRSASM